MTIQNELVGLAQQGEVSAKDAAKVLALPVPAVIEAMKEADADGRARMFRRGQGGAVYLAPNGSQHLICPNCRMEFERPKKSRRKSCSRSCAVALSWTDPKVRDRRVSGIKADCAKPERRAKLAELNRKRWARPEEKEKLAEQNRKMWHDPYRAARRSVSIKAAHSTPERREFYAELRRKEWADPEKRRERIEAMKAAKSTPEFKQRFRKLMEDRWKDPELRKKFVEANRRRAERQKAAVKKRHEAYRKSEEADVIRRMRERGLSAAACAEKLGKSPDYIRHKLKILKEAA